LSEDANKITVTASMPSRRPKKGEQPWEVNPVVRANW